MISIFQNVNYKNLYTNVTVLRLKQFMGSIFFNKPVNDKVFHQLNISEINYMCFN